MTANSAAPEPAYLMERRAQDAAGSWGAALAALRRDGVAVLDLGEGAVALCDRVTAEVEGLAKGLAAGRVQDAWRRSAAVRELAVHSEVLAFLRCAYGREPFAFQTLNFRVGTEQEIHSDTVHFNALPEGFMCGVWVALEDISPDSGPLRYYPGSHLLPRLTMADAGVTGRAGQSQDYGEHYVPALAAQLAAAGLEPRTATLSKGQALVWAANLAHGGSPIANPHSTRRSMVTHFYFRDGLYFTPMFSNEPADALLVRLPQDVATGQFVWPRRDGRVAWPGVVQIAGALARRVLRKVRAS